MTKPTVLLLGSIVHATKEWNALSSIATLKECESKDRAEFIKDCAGKYADVVAIYRTFPSASITGRFDAELVPHLPASLKFISHNGAGYDQLDIEPLTKRGILVSNCPRAVDAATADTNMFLILGALRNFNKGMSQLRKGEFKDDVPIAHDPEGKTLGILGMGGIGRALARRARAFDMKIIYHNRRPLATPELSAGAEYVSFDELLQRSDVLSLNLPLSPATRHTIGKDQFARMKDGVVVVNTARGAVMDEAALVDALDSGKVASAGLDVFEEEPKIHPGLMRNENVILVPHLGTHTVETQHAMEALVIANVKSAIESGKLLTPVPEQHNIQEPLI